MKFKNDSFKKNRGGYSRWLFLSCEKCKEPLFIYQKDGPGILKRLYIDRISSEIACEDLYCKKCGVLLGVPIVYKKEGRPAIRLFPGSVEKKIIQESQMKNILP